MPLCLYTYTFLTYFIECMQISILLGMFLIQDLMARTNIVW